MALSVQYQFPRATRTSLNALASAAGLRPGQAYLLTDENRIAVALTTTAYETFARQSEGKTPNPVIYWQRTSGTGTGVSQNLTLPQAVGQDEAIVTVNGLEQEAGVDYTISGAILTITAPLGAKIRCRYLVAESGAPVIYAPTDGRAADVTSGFSAVPGSVGAS